MGSSASSRGGGAVGGENPDLSKEHSGKSASQLMADAAKERFEKQAEERERQEAEKMKGKLIERFRAVGKHIPANINKMTWKEMKTLYDAT